jgi:hypothetical protein
VPSYRGGGAADAAGLAGASYGTAEDGQPGGEGEGRTLARPLTGEVGYSTVVHLRPDATGRPQPVT